MVMEDSEMSTAGVDGNATLMIGAVKNVAWMGSMCLMNLLRLSNLCVRMMTRASKERVMGDTKEMLA